VSGFDLKYEVLNIGNTDGCKGTTGKLSVAREYQGVRKCR
jgi:hypothetical protein